MIDIEKLKEITTDSRLIEFAEFIIAATGKNEFPDYNKLDLMNIAKLVSHVFVLEVEPATEKKKRLRIKFSGTGFDQLYGINAMGKYLEDIYCKENRDIVINNNYELILKKRPCFFHFRSMLFNDLKNLQRTVSRISFPCSSNGEEINFVIGISDFDIGHDGGKDFIKFL